MKCAFFTLGCKVNQYESAAMAQELTRCGFQCVDPHEEADVYIINSCTVTAESDRKTRQAVRRFRKNHPDSIIVLTGCMVQASPETEEILPEADIVLGNKNIDKLYGVILNFINSGNSCNRFCSYCIIPYARGRVRSKPIDDIKSETLALASNGYKEIVLVGINLSAYGTDIGLNLVDAVKAVADIEKIERIRLGSLEPDHITDDVIAGLAGIEKFCPQFHISLQSGCDKTLKKMNRHYNTVEYEDLCMKIRSTFKDATLTTDVMVGFPGESNSDFDISLNFVKKTAFEKVHVFPYSRRPGTPAAGMENQVENSVKQQRAEIMSDECEKIRDSALKRQTGKTVEIIPEENNNGKIKGYTKNYIPVEIGFDAEIGEIVKVKIISAENGICQGVKAD